VVDSICGDLEAGGEIKARRKRGGKKDWRKMKEKENYKQ
jgi:hypothetical protein